MLKRTLLLILLLTACSSASPVLELPTVAVLPTLVPTATETPIRDLLFWESASGVLNTPEQEDHWRFRAEAGDGITLRALGPVTLTLERDGTGIAGPGESLAVTLTTAGDYLVRVRLAEGNSGRYDIGLGYSDRPNPASFTATPPPQTVGVPTPTPPLTGLGTFIDSLGTGSSRAGTLTATDSLHVYTFEGRAGEYTSIAMSPISGEIDPILTLYSPDGLPLAVDDNTGGNRAALLRNLLLRENGTYTIQAGGGSGTYQIALTSGSQPLPVTPTLIAQPTVGAYRAAAAFTPSPAPFNSRLSDHVPVLGSIDRPGYVQRYFFSAVPGEFVTLTARPLTNFRPVIDVISPAGELLRSATLDTDAGETFILLLPVTESDLYTLMITAEDNATGDFVLAYGIGATREEIIRGQAAADTPYESAIARRAVREVWKVPLYEGDVITATVSPLTNTLDPVLELSGPDGTVIALDDNGGGYPNPLLREVRIPATGMYDLRVYAANADSVGPYRLVWRYVSVAPTFTPDPARYLVMTVSDSISSDQYQFYPFQGQAGQQLRIQVIAEPGSSLDPVAALLGPDGQEIAAGDDSETDLNPRFMVNIPADGTYTVRVNGYLSTGPFTLLVEALY